MPRTKYANENSGYNEIDANSKFEEYSVARRKLVDDMVVDAYTGGLKSTRAASEAITIDEKVRRKR